MKHIFTKLICTVLCFQLAALPTAQPVKADSLPAGFENNSTLRLIRSEIAANPAFYYAEENLTTQGTMENKAMALTGLQEIVEKCRDTSYPLQGIREQLALQALAEEEAQMIEIRFVLQRMPAETIDQVFSEAFHRGTYDPALRQDFENAYTAREKREILIAMAQTDLYQIKSLTLKRLGLLDREGLIRELSLVQNLLNTKGKDTWKIVLVVVLSVAVAGFVSWGIVSATKKHWEKKTRQAEADEKKHEEEATEEYANKEKNLQIAFEDRAKLREDGYVWAVCSTETKSAATACSYDYKTHSGSMLCTTYCMKNYATGDSKFPQTTCSSAFIPSNCSLPNPYQDGYDHGNDAGYSDGYNNGYDRAYRDAYDDYYRQGYDKGYLSGYDYGYNDGYYDGWGQAEYDDTKSSSEVVDMSALKMVKSAAKDSVGFGYKSGYREGFAMATTLRIGQ
ncbi:MAG TPA: hypothetical protein DCS07_05860 [Bdellovibrionales bacterium]|nr:MAG: hypothetical protein A2Z97_06545 [Bdellovibrionales bacterium GWB1_52_6]OFZ05141.1 MAG: hypothetical protein A2X97_09310 [Bdellovibrionales bacterium GWA1_52_35]HAR42142.1 hypothetical protein [Bdellovibrionales bacterium]HCM38891.1 hypothetical protein [Bdellovibrionales bacterium]